MFGDCCTRHFAKGESVCPVCHAQANAGREEREKAAHYRTELSDVKENTWHLLEQRAVPTSEAALGTSISTAALARKNPARRQLFKLIGIYLPEREARVALARIHEFKWLEAEKAGFDIWRVNAPECPTCAAAKNWADSYLEPFLDYHEVAA